MFVPPPPPTWQVAPAPVHVGLVPPPPPQQVSPTAPQGVVPPLPSGRAQDPFMHMPIVPLPVQVAPAATHMAPMQQPPPSQVLAAQQA
jgi:hypothetical protein